MICIDLCTICVLFENIGNKNTFFFAFPSITKNLASTRCSWFSCQEPVEPVEGESGLPVGEAGEEW